MRLRLIIPSTFVFLLAACSAASPQAAPTGTEFKTQKPQHNEPTAFPTATPTPAPSLPPSPTPRPLGAWCPLPEAPIPSDGGELQLALIGNQKIWVWTERDGMTALADPGEDFHDSSIYGIGFSDDGAYVAWTVVRPKDQVELWAQRLDGGAAVRLITPDWFSEMGKHPTKTVVPMDLHWVPGTHTIGFHTNLAGTSYGFYYTPDNLWWIDVETGKALPKKVDGEIFYSPDGKLAAGVNQKNAFLMNADTSGQRIIPIENYHLMPQGTSYAEPPRIHWAEDSRSFFVIAPEAVNHLDPNHLVTIWQVIVEDPIATRFAVLDSGDGSIIFSPDHQWVAIKRRTEADHNRYELYLARADGSEEFRYREVDPMTRIQWSPDSRRFIFWTGLIPYLGDLCSEPIALMDQPPSEYDVESPDELDAVWLDQARYLLKPNNLKNLYQGDITRPEIPAQLLLQGSFKVFDWRLIPDALS